MGLLREHSCPVLLSLRAACGGRVEQCRCLSDAYLLNGQIDEARTALQEGITMNEAALKRPGLPEQFRQDVAGASTATWSVPMPQAVPQCGSIGAFTHRGCPGPSQSIGRWDDNTLTRRNACGWEDAARLGDMCAAMGELERQAKNWKEALRALRRAAEHFGTLEGAQHFQSATLNRVGFTYLEKGALKVCVCLCVCVYTPPPRSPVTSLLDAASLRLRPPSPPTLLAPDLPRSQQSARDGGRLALASPISNLRRRREPALVAGKALRSSSAERLTESLLRSDLKLSAGRPEVPGGADRATVSDATTHGPYPCSPHQHTLTGGLGPGMVCAGGDGGAGGGGSQGGDGAG